jgi:hypothetical protein
MSTNALGPRGLIRQGDLLLVPVVGVPQPGTRVLVEEATADRHVLADGEATGHAHVAEGRSLRLTKVALRRGPYGTERRTFLVVEGDEDAKLVHEEHSPLALSPGTYEVRRQHEYEPSNRRSWRTVRD